MKKIKWFSFLMLGGLLAMTSCGGGDNILEDYKKVIDYDREVIDDKYRTYYEIFVGSYYDGSGDHKGDLKGVTAKLDYLEYLGVSGIWMMPINPSTSYHKYDVEDYLKVDSSYGTLADFEELATKAKEKDINIILDLVINHSSSRHAWFKSALATLALPVCAVPNGDGTPTESCKQANKYIDYYTFKYNNNVLYYRFTNVGQWYYEAYFDDAMPDLNLDNEDVKAEIVEIMEFWIEKGASGFRLDAAMHYFESQHTKNSEFLSWLNNEAKKIKEDIYFVAEVWNTSLEKSYYSSGLDSFFSFSFGTASGTTTKSLVINDANWFAYAAENYYNDIKNNSTTAIAANFLGNHDMPRNANAYAGAAKEQKVKMANAMNLTLTGTSFMYYGEEIGMVSETMSDPNYRTAMLWSDYPDEIGFCTNAGNGKTREQKFPTLETQISDPTSIFNFTRKAVALRNKYPWMARGVPKQIDIDKETEVAIVEKNYDGEKYYIVYSLSEEVKTITFAEGDKILDVLATNGLNSKLKNGTLTIQPYSITILK